MHYMQTESSESALVSCEWLQRHLDGENQVVLDATFFLPRQQRDAQAEYRQCHLPGAGFFDIDQIADPANPLPYSLPRAGQFAAAAGKLGIGNAARVILYDNNHFFAAARAWWMFRVFGHDQVWILDGGLKRWLQLSFSVQAGESAPEEKRFRAQYRPELVFDLPQMQRILLSGDRQVLDARSPDSFLGRRPLADPGLEPGHIPGSINIPYAGLTDGERDTLLPRQRLRAMFDAAGVDLTRPLVTSCGSGVSAAVLSLAIHELGVTDAPLYDGSWAEWGRAPDTPKIRG